MILKRLNNNVKEILYTYACNLKNKTLSYQNKFKIRKESSESNVFFPHLQIILICIKIP